MSDQCADENERGHSSRHAATRLVNLVDQEIVPAVRIPSEVMVKESNGKTSDGKKPQGGGMLPMNSGHFFE